MDRQIESNIKKLSITILPIEDIFLTCGSSVDEDYLLSPDCNLLLWKLHVQAFSQTVRPKSVCILQEDEYHQRQRTFDLLCVYTH